MNHSIKHVRYLYRSSVVRRGLGLVLLVAVGFGSPTSHADPGDFKAMPGLWKTVVRITRHGQPGQPSIRWHCVDEDADPWLVFADISVPGEQCQRSDEHRSSTALTWALNCSGRPPVSGRGRVDFDSPEHYSASIVLQDRGEVVHIEGQRRAACTGPSD